MMDDVVRRQIRRLRQEKGLTQAQLAVYAGVDPSAVSQIETGNRNPNTTTLIKLAEALGVAVTELFQEPTAPKASTPPEARAPDMEEQRLHLAPWGHLVTALNERWLKQIEDFEKKGEVPLAWAWEIKLTNLDLMEALEEKGVTAKLNPILEAIHKDEEVSEVLRREAVRLYNGLVLMFTVVVPRAMKQATHLEERTHLDAQLDEKAEEWRRKYSSPLDLNIANDESPRLHENGGG